MLMDRVPQVKVRCADVIAHQPVPGLPDYPEDGAHSRAEERTTPRGVAGREGAPDIFHRAINRQATTIVGVKTGGSRVGGPKKCVLGSMVTGGKGHNVYPGSGPLDGGKTLLLLD